MQVDPRLNDIDDCLYRVAVRVLVMQDDKVLLVKEHEDWWAFPGGGVDHGETVETTLTREIEEELGVLASDVLTDYQIVYYNIGAVLSGVPRMNIYFKVSVPEQSIQKTDEVSEWQWFSRDEFMAAELNATYDKTKLAEVIFGK